MGRIHSLRGTTLLPCLTAEHSSAPNARHTSEATPALLFQAAASRPEAPVGNSGLHLNLKKLTADDSFSLKEDELLLCTINAFVSAISL